MRWLVALLFTALAVPVNAEIKSPFFDLFKSDRLTAPSSFCRVTGKTAGLDPRLKTRLCAMSRALGPVQVISGCRNRGSRRAPNSYHKRSRGCKAADVRVRGAGKRRILNYWARSGGGGRGYYCGRSFVHVDIGPNRAWAWYC